MLAHHSGVVRIEDEEGGRRITVVADDGTEESVLVSARAHLEVTAGQEVAAGDALVEGPKDPKELLEVKGIRETQQYLVEEVQKVYRDQGVSIHDKHIELIVRQMLRRVLVAEPGDAPFLPGERVDAQVYAEVNRGLVQEAKRPAEGRPELMGITKASLATDSWLSAASFQETTRVLTEAAIEGKSDHLFGLKENIIIGKLIPAGTGMERYRDIAVDLPDAAGVSLRTYGFDEETEDLAAWLRDVGGPTGGGDAGFGEAGDLQPAATPGVRSSPGSSRAWGRRPTATARGSAPMATARATRAPSHGSRRQRSARGPGAVDPAPAPRTLIAPETPLSSTIACSRWCACPQDARTSQFPRVKSCSILREVTRAHDRTARPQGTGVQAVEDQDAGAEGRAPAARRVHAGLHDHAQEAELGPAQGGPGAADERHRGERLHPRRRATTSRSTPSCSSAAAG